MNLKVTGVAYCRHSIYFINYSSLHKSQAKNVYTHSHLTANCKYKVSLLHIYHKTMVVPVVEMVKAQV